MKDMFYGSFCRVLIVLLIGSGQMLSAEALTPMAKVSIQAMCGTIIQELHQQSDALPFRLDEKQARYFSTSSEVGDKCCRYMQDCQMRVKMGCHDGTVVHLKVSPQQEKTAALEMRDQLICQSGDPAQIAGYFIHFKKATSRDLRAKAKQINSKLKKHCRAHLDQKILETALRMTARPSHWKRTLQGAIRGMKTDERKTFLNELSKVLSTHLKSSDGDAHATNTNMKDILAELKRTGQATALGPLWKQEIDSAAGVATASSMFDQRQIQHLVEQNALKNPKLGQVSVLGPDGHPLTAHVAPDKNGGSNVFLIEKTNDDKKDPAWNSKCTVLGGLAQCQYNKNPAKVQLGSNPVTGALQVSSSYSMTAQADQNQTKNDVQHTSADFKTIRADGQNAPDASTVAVSDLAQAKTGATNVSVIGIEAASDQSAANNSVSNAQSQTHVIVAGSSRGDKLGVGALINGHIQSTETPEDTADTLNKGADTQINLTYFGDTHVFNNQWKRTCDGQTQCANTFMETTTGTLHKTKTANLSDNVNFAVSPDAQNLSTSGGLTRSHTIASSTKDGPNKTRTTGINLGGTNDQKNGITSESLSLTLGLAKQLHHNLSKTTSASDSNSKMLNLTGQLNQNPTGPSTTLSGEIALPHSVATENTQFKSRSNTSKSNSIRVASTFGDQKLQEIDLSWQHLNTRGLNENQFQRQASFAVGLNDNLEFHSVQGQVGMSCTAVDESTGQALSNSPYRLDAILNGDWSADSYGASIKISGPLGARVRCGQ